VEHTSDDRVFVQALIDGDEHAWREFETRYGRLVERCISGVTSRFSAVVGQDDVEEIRAIVILRLIDHDKRKLKTFDPERGHSFKGWLGMLAVQATYDYLRRKRRQVGRERDFGFDLHSTAPPDPYETCWGRERTEIGRRLLEQFGERDREFMQHYLRGLPPDQIAANMGISVATVYSKKHKVRAQLERLVTRRAIAA
jgi:RNA polymerase sigma-70 factor (ECF subfamily)